MHVNLLGQKSTLQCLKQRLYGPKVMIESVPNQELTSHQDGFIDKISESDIGD